MNARGLFASILTGFLYTPFIQAQAPEPIALMRGAIQAREAIKSGLIELDYRQISMRNGQAEGRAKLAIRFDESRWTIEQRARSPRIKGYSREETEAKYQQYQAMRGTATAEDIERSGVARYVDSVVRTAYDGHRYCQFSNTGGAGYREFKDGTGDVMFPPRMFGLTFHYNSQQDLPEYLNLLSGAKSSKCIGPEPIGEVSVWHVEFDLGPSRCLCHYWIEDKWPFRVHRVELRSEAQHDILTADYNASPAGSPLPTRVATKNVVKTKTINERELTATRMELNGSVGDRIGTIASLDLPIGHTVSDEASGKILGYWDGTKISSDPSVADNPRTNEIVVGENKSVNPSVFQSFWIWIVGLGLVTLALVARYTYRVRR
jgi:hypothetical protein